MVLSGCERQDFEDALRLKNSEIEEAIREGNRKYSEMIAVKLDKEDELLHRIDCLEAKGKQDSFTIQKMIEEASASQNSFKAKLDHMKHEFEEKEERLEAS